MTKTGATETDQPSPALPPGASEPDLRTAPRAMLMLRSAKLICDSGEYVCLIRDVSSSGVRLRLFHALPREAGFSLELGNGAVHPMEVKWFDGDQAGFQFVQPIDVNAFTEEGGVRPRRPLRLRLNHSGQVISAGRNSPMVLRDISQSGVRIETTNWLALHQIVKLDFGGVPDCFVQVRWRKGYEHGVAFVHGFTLGELATLAVTLQPFAAPAPSAASENASQPRASASG